MFKFKTILLEIQMESIIDSFETSIRSKYSKQLDSFGIYLQPNNSLFFSELYIKPEYRGKGFGSKIMEEVLRFADGYKLAVVLIPEPDELTKAAVSRLVTYYKRFGFVMNSGKNANDTLKIPSASSMYRLPK